LICEKVDFHIVAIFIFGFNNRIISAFENSELVEHYWEHKELNPEMTLTAFLKTHYDHPVKDGDYGKDQKLPFIIHSAPLSLFLRLIRNSVLKQNHIILMLYNLIKFLQKMKIFVTKDLQDPSGNRQGFLFHNSVNLICIHRSRSLLFYIINFRIMKTLFSAILMVVFAVGIHAQSRLEMPKNKPHKIKNLFY
jgi:hypothetical protein